MATISTSGFFKIRFASAKRARDAVPDAAPWLRPVSMMISIGVMAPGPTRPLTSVSARAAWMF